MILSICIPTFDRQAYLLQTVQECLMQIDQHHLWAEVEVCVSNNCSTDDTQALLAGILHSSLRVVNQPYSVPSNFYNVTQMARGQFTWLLSDDDLPYPGSISKILKYLKGDPADITILGFDFQLATGHVFPNRFVTDRDGPLRFSLPDEQLDWFNRSISLAGIGGLISTLLYKTGPILHGYAETYDLGITSGYSHLAAIFYAIRERFISSIEILSSPLFLYRAQNERICKPGVERVAFDVNAWAQLSPLIPKHCLNQWDRLLDLHHGERAVLAAMQFIHSKPL